MRIKLNCRTHDGKAETWHYDNVSNIIWDGAGAEIDLAKDERVKAYLQGGFQDSAERYAANKGKQICTLRIQLGLKCNMHCRYCAQTHDKDREGWVSSPKDVPGFIDKLKASGIEVIGSVQLWGGEPFVYWKTLLRLIPALREMYPKAAICMISNGTLLSEEKIEFLRGYGCSLSLSHDAQGYRLRGPDPLDNPETVDLWRLAVKRLNANINCVLSPANTDLDAIASFFKEKLGDVRVYFEGVMTHCGVQERELIFSDVGLPALQRSVFYALTREKWGKFPALKDQASGFLRTLAQRKRLPERAAKCQMGAVDNMAITMNGDVLSCHDYANPEAYVGRIEALDKVDISRHFKPWSARPKCRKCLVLGLCRGACPQIEGLARTLTCKNEFAYAFAIFQAVFWLLFGVTLLSFEPEQPEEGKEET